MKVRIWRKDSTRPIKDDKNNSKEELTDISLSSTPKHNDKKDKMEEIYSTKDKQVKYKRQTPLEAEEAAKRAKAAKEKLASGKAEITLETPAVPDKIVELTSDYEEGTVIADDIIENIADFSNTRTVHIQDIDEIDIDIDPSTALKKYERQVMQTKRHDERNKPKPHVTNDLFKNNKIEHGPKIVAKIPTYQHESKINKIHLKAGRFTDVVENEYDEYLKSNDPTISKKIDDINHISSKQSLLYTLSQLAHKNNQKTDNESQKPQKEKPQVKEAVEKQPKIDADNSGNKEKKKQNKIKKFLKISTAAKKTIKASPDKKQPDAQTQSDYQDRQDSKFVAKEINNNYKKLGLKAIAFVILFLVSFVLSIINLSSDGVAFSQSTTAMYIYCSVNLVILLLIGFVAKAFIIGGLKPLAGFRGNSDTALSCAYVACLIQQIASLAYPYSFVDTSMHLYTTIIAFGFATSVIGRMVMVARVRRNFRFLTSKNPSYAAKIYSDEDTARKMLSGTTASRSVVAYQHPTDFLSDFLKISYAPDPSEEMVGRIAPITIISSIFVGIAYGVTFNSFIGGLCALAAMCCISIPICILLAGNIPMLFFCKESLKHNAMLSGYPSVRQFCDCDAVMMSARQLYPKASIKLNHIEYFADFRVEDSLLYAYAVSKEAKSPLRHIFKQLTENAVHTAKRVESVLYEDKLGLVGWVNGERILIGNRKLLDRYHITIDSSIDEQTYTEKGNDVTFVACSGQLVCMLITTYTPDKAMKAELKKAQSAGLCIIVKATDPNITQEKIASDYDVFFRCIKILNAGYATVSQEVMSKREETSRAYVATKGKVASLLYAISGSVFLKNNLTIGVVIQIFGLLLGVLLCATMILYASVSILNIFEMLMYMLFWGAATIVAQLIKRR